MPERPDRSELAPLRGRWLRYAVGGISVAFGVVFLLPTMESNPPSDGDPLFWLHLLGLGIVLLGLWVAIDAGPSR
jgi:hypothetical protein